MCIGRRLSARSARPPPAIRPLLLGWSRLRFHPTSFLSLLMTSAGRYREKPKNEQSCKRIDVVCLTGSSVETWPSAALLP